MTALTNFNNFELNTNEKENVNGGWGCYSYKRSYSYSNCYSNYSNNCYSNYSNNCYSNCYSSCEPAEEAVVEGAPVIEAAPAVIETPESLTPPRGVSGL